MVKYWMVHNPKGRTPTFMHQNEDSANREATRLARLNPGESFVVLEAVHRVRAVDVQIERLYSHDPMPF